MSEIVDVKPELEYPVNPIETPESHRIGTLLLRAGEGALLGVILVGGYTAADAVSDTQYTENIGGVEATSELHPGSASSVTVLGNTAYQSTHQSLLGQNIGASINFEKLPAISDLPTAGVAIAGLSQNLPKAGEGIEQALKHKYFQELQHDSLVNGGVSGPLFAFVFVGGEVLLGGRRRDKRTIENHREEVRRLQAEISGLKSEQSAPDEPTVQKTAPEVSVNASQSVETKESSWLRFAAKRVAAIVAVGALSVGAGVLKLQADSQNGPAPEDRISITSLEPLGVEGVYTDDIDTKENIDSFVHAYQKVFEDLRSERRQFVDTATQSLDEQIGAIASPKPGESMFTVFSDMHSSLAMLTMLGKTVQAVNAMNPENQIAFAISAGDDNYGTSIEKGTADKEVQIFHGAPLEFVLGNHNGKVSLEQFLDAGAKWLNGTVVNVDGVPIIGVNDPMVTELFGPTVPRSDSSETDAGNKLYEEALKSGDMPIGVTHEGTAAGAVLGFKDATQAKLTQWFNQRGSNTIPWEDGVRDLPVSLLIYGHWHRIIMPRTVYNSDGTWTTVMELNTAGGAIADTSFDHFNTPLGKPGQAASFPIMFRNDESGLITGYQMYTYSTDGKLTLSPRIDIGSPNGQPFVADNSTPGQAKADRHQPQGDAQGQIEQTHDKQVALEN